MRSVFPARRAMASTFADQRRAIVDAVVIVVGLTVVYLIIRDLNLYEALTSFVDQHEDLQLDEVIIVVLLSALGLIIFGARRIQDQRREIRARQRAEDRAQHLAMADTLTGLPNRRQFEQRMQAAIESIRRNGSNPVCADDAGPRSLQAGQRRLRPYGGR
jgi:predicted signal transduction protein with EAL and GGDEF domain